MLTQPKSKSPSVVHMDPELAYLGLVSYLLCYALLLESNVVAVCSLIISEGI